MKNHEPCHLTPAEPCERDPIGVEKKKWRRNGDLFANLNLNCPFFIGYRSIRMYNARTQSKLATSLQTQLREYSSSFSWEPLQFSSVKVLGIKAQGDVVDPIIE